MSQDQNLTLEQINQKLKEPMLPQERAKLFNLKRNMEVNQMITLVSVKDGKVVEVPRLTYQTHMEHYNNKGFFPEGEYEVVPQHVIRKNPVVKVAEPVQAVKAESIQTANVEMPVEQPVQVVEEPKQKRAYNRKTV